MTDATPPDSPKRNPFMEEAALWFARMRGPEAEEHREAFEAWLSRGALHRAAYNRAGEIFSVGKFLEAEKPEIAEEQPAGAENENGQQDDRDRRLFPILFLAAGALLILTWSLWARPEHDAAHTDRAIAKTDKLETSLRLRTDTVPVSQRLSDGSMVRLQPATSLLVTFDAKHRKLNLERGIARFDVAHEDRPFTVLAGGGSVTARGTLFEVCVDADKLVTVKLIRGRIDVAMPRTGLVSAPVSHLEPGQSVSFSANAGTTPSASVPTPLPSATPSSRAALHQFDGNRLDDLLAQANAQSPVKIRLADPQMGSRTVSGRFVLSDPRKLAERLAWIFEGHVEREPNGDLLISSR